MEIQTQAATPLEKTERLLYAYPRLRGVIKKKNELISEIQEAGLPKRSKSITKFTPNGGYQETATDEEKAQTEIESLKEDISSVSFHIRQIELALEAISGDPYYGIIPMKYFERLTNEAVADRLAALLERESLDSSTVSRNKARLLDEIRLQLFPVSWIEEIMG